MHTRLIYLLSNNNSIILEEASSARCLSEMYARACVCVHGKAVAM